MPSEVGWSEAGPLPRDLLASQWPVQDLISKSLSSKTPLKLGAWLRLCCPLCSDKLKSPQVPTLPTWGHAASKTLRLPGIAPKFHMGQWWPACVGRDPSVLRGSGPDGGIPVGYVRFQQLQVKGSEAHHTLPVCDAAIFLEDGLGQRQLPRSQWPWQGAGCSVPVCKFSASSA